MRVTGDLVWALVPGHPWWPGQVMDPAKAPPKLHARIKPSTVLVSFLGDATYNWLKEDCLVPFLGSHFEEHSAQKTKNKAFRRAVEEALELQARRAGQAPATDHRPDDFLVPAAEEPASDSEGPEAEAPEAKVDLRPPAADEEVARCMGAERAAAWLRAAARGDADTLVEFDAGDGGAEALRDPAALTVTADGWRMERRRQPSGQTPVIFFAPGNSKQLRSRKQVAAYCEEHGIPVPDLAALPAAPARKPIQAPGPAGSRKQGPTSPAGPATNGIHPQAHARAQPPASRAKVAKALRPALKSGSAAAPPVQLAPPGPHRRVVLRFPKGFPLPSAAQVAARLRRFAPRLSTDDVLPNSKAYVVAALFPDEPAAAAAAAHLKGAADAMFSAVQGSISVSVEDHRPAAVQALAAPSPATVPAARMGSGAAGAGWRSLLPGPMPHAHSEQSRATMIGNLRLVIPRDPPQPVLTSPVLSGRPIWVPHNPAVGGELLSQLGLM
ncbi:hypothetical protein WJX81_003019 [Elliptochloris bilobata]|uniref:PWWP domain-containing protein n=1 Tax=Elliptochloris bilobata TaxID=381761 RepID=A0AAW1RB37_9CHLO